MQMPKEMTIARGILIGCLWLFSGQSVLAQASDSSAQTSSGETRILSSIVTLDPEKLFSQSAFGIALIADLNARTEALAAENRAIEADLTQEEKDLAARRPTMDPSAFRAAAQEFDSKVQEIRQAQDAKERELQQTASDSRDRFFAAARPFLGEVMLAHGAGLVLDRRSVFLSVEAIDITDEVLAIVDERLGASIAEDPATTDGN